MRHLYGLILLLVASLLLAGCGGGGGGGSASGGGNSGGGGGGGAGGDSKFTAEEREAAMDKIADKYDELAANNPAGAMEALAQFAKTQSEFSNAVAKDKTLVAHFKDGRPFLFLDNFESQAKAGFGGGLDTFAGDPLPGNEPALLLQSALEDTQGNWPYMTQISQMLSKRGYTTTTSNGIHIDNLKAQGRNLGVFYIHTHGAPFWWHDDFETREYGLVTDTMVTAENEGRYADDIKKGRMIYTRVKSRPMDPDGNRGRYCITSRFVAAYFSMKDRGVVYINACAGSSPDAVLFKQTFHSVGAGLYIGYTGNTTDFCYEPAAYFFDRMLGGNLAEPPNPAGRPFKVDEVWEKMALKKHAQNTSYNYLTDPENGTFLVKSDAGVTLLTPNVKALKFYFNDYMGIVTDLPAGTPHVKVKIDGQEFPFQWKDGMIMVQLGTDTKGDVQVFYKERQSNKRPVVSWRGLVTYVQPATPGSIGGDAKLTVKYNVHLRSDGYPIRTKVDGPLQDNATQFWAAMDSTASYQFSGSIGGATWTGAGTFPIDHHAGPGNKFSTTGLVHAMEKRMKFFPNFYEPVATIVYPAGSHTQVYAPAIGGWEFHDPLPVPGREIVYRGWYMEFDDKLNIKPKTYTGFIQNLWIHRISWDQIQADPPYREEVER